MTITKNVTYFFWIFRCVFRKPATIKKVMDYLKKVIGNKFFYFIFTLIGFIENEAKIHST